MVSIAIRLWAKWSSFQILVGARRLSLLQNIQTSSGAHSASHSMSTSLFPGGKVAGVWHGVIHSPISTAKVKNE